MIDINQDVLLIGGTGYIGRYITDALLERNCRVTILSRNPEAHQNTFPPGVVFAKGNIDEITDEAFSDLLKPCHSFIFAAGCDERIPPVGNAREFYFKANVEPCVKLCKAARKNKVSHGVILNSIFNMQHRLHPELELANKHPYIASRVEQDIHCRDIAENHFILTTLEVPWVFGPPHHGPSQWQNLIDYVRGSVPIMCCRGGANIVSCRSLAQATANSLYYPEQSTTMAIGDLNVTYKELLKHICQYSERHDQQTAMIDDDFFIDLMKTGGKFKELLRIESGLDTAYIAELLLENLYVDNTESAALLHYDTGIALDAIRQTVEYARENAAMKYWRQFLNIFTSKS